MAGLHFLDSGCILTVVPQDQSYRSAESDVLFNYIFEWGEAKDSYTAEHPKRLSFTDNIEYINDGGNDLVRLINENKMIPAYYASSGVQSAMPKGRGDSMLVMTTHSPYILPL